jgi:hypothetical protein
MKISTRFSFFILLLVLLLGSSTFLWSQSLTFDITDLQGVHRWAPIKGPHIFTVYTPAPVMVFAWSGFDWLDGVTESVFIESEGVDDLLGVDPVVEMYVSGFDLHSLEFVNVVNFGGDPFTPGERGDFRIYTGGTATMHLNGVKIAEASNFQVDILVSYPVIGGGPGQLAQAVGVADINMAETDPDWVVRFDNGSGQFEFEFENFTAGIGPNHDTTVTILSRDVHTTVDDAILVADDTVDFDASIGVVVDFEFTDPMVYDEGAGEVEVVKTLTVNKIYGDAGGVLPAEVLSFNSQFYYRFGAVLDGFQCDITFDLSEVPNLPTDLEDVVFMRRPKRAPQDYVWEVIPNEIEILSVTPPRLLVKDVTGFSEWGIGFLTDDSLPVELSSFTSSVTANGFVELTWITESESNMLGYHIHRAEDNNVALAEKITGEVINAENSSTTVYYNYTDKNLPTAGTYYYWLEFVELDLTSGFHGPISAVVSFDNDDDTPGIVYRTELIGAFPNPFNPETSIEFTLADPSHVTLRIFNSRGQLVKELLANDQLAAGFYSEVWDGRDNSGASVGSGVYFYRMKVDNSYDMIKKMVLVK